MAEKTFKQVCECKNCGNEAEMVVTCSLEEHQVESAEPQIVATGRWAKQKATLSAATAAGKPTSGWMFETLGLIIEEPPRKFIYQTNGIDRDALKDRAESSARSLFLKYEHGASGSNRPLTFEMPDQRNNDRSPVTIYCAGERRLVNNPSCAIAHVRIKRLLFVHKSCSGSVTLIVVTLDFIKES